MTRDEFFEFVKLLASTASKVRSLGGIGDGVAYRLLLDRKSFVMFVTAAMDAWPTHNNLGPVGDRVRIHVPAGIVEIVADWCAT